MNEKMSEELEKIKDFEAEEVFELEPANEESCEEVSDDSVGLGIGRVAAIAVAGILLFEGTKAIAKRGKTWICKRMENRKLKKEDEKVQEEKYQEDSDFEEENSKEEKPNKK